MFRGDVGKFRLALEYCGYPDWKDEKIYNDKHTNGSRRLKLMFASRIPGKSHDNGLQSELKKNFGNRLLSCGFIDCDSRMTYTAYVVHLKD